MALPDFNNCKNLLSKSFSLIPIKENKIPLIQWKSYQEKSMSESEFENFYNLPDTVDIGIVTGYKGFEVIDIDTKVLPTTAEKNDFFNEYISLLKDNIEDFESKFIIVKTRSGGYHICYKTGSPSGNKKIASLKGYTEAIIESRGIGGYVIMYSNFVQGSSYNDIKVISDNDKEILWTCSQTYNHIEEVKIKYENVRKEHNLNKDGLKPWEDFDNRNSCFDLVSHEFDIIRKNSKGTLIIRRKGAKSPHSGYIYESNLMYLFSTGTQYPAQKALSPSAILAIQKYNGDFSKAASELYKQGYGERRLRNTKSKIIKPEEEINIKELDFPIEIYPENIQAYITDVHNTLNASIDFLGSAFMWVLSLCVGNAAKIKVKTGWSEPGVIWVAIVGRAGIGKTHNIESIVRPLKKINEKEIALYNKQLEKYRQYQALDNKDKKKAEEVQEPQKKQFIVGDITMEAFIDYHASNKNGIGILRDELSGWIKDLNKYRDGSDLETYLSCWSGQLLNLTRKTARSGYVSNAFVPIIGGVQPSVLSMHFTPENKDNGFIDRWLLCYPDLVVEKFNENEMREEVIEWYDEFIIGFFEQIRNKVLKYSDDGDVIPFKLSFESEAKKEWIRIFNKITDMQNSEDENEFMKSILPKQKSYVARFSLLLNMLDDYGKGKAYGKIRKESVLNAEKLSDYFIMMAKKNKFDSLENNEIKETLKASGKNTAYEKFQFIYQKDNKCNRSKVAEELNVSRMTINRWIKEIEKV